MFLFPVSQCTLSGFTGITSVHIIGNCKTQPGSLKVTIEITFLIASVGNLVIQPLKKEFSDLGTSSWQRNNVGLFSFSASPTSCRYLRGIGTLKEPGKFELSKSVILCHFAFSALHWTRKWNRNKKSSIIHISYYILHHSKSCHD